MSILDEIEEYTPDAQDIELFKLLMLNKIGKLIYKKVANDKYEVLCTRCGNKEIVSKITLEQMINTQICSHCHQYINTARKRDYQVIDYVVLGGDKKYGFKIVYNWSADGEEELHYKQVAYWNGSNTYVKGIIINMYCITEYRDEWRKVRNNNNYICYFYAGLIDNSKTRKQYYEQFELPKLKSNQVEIVKNNLLDLSQIRYIKMFDLKDYGSISKYRTYMKNHKIYNDSDVELNIYYLDYLARNNISINDYLDYVNDCKELNIKPQKPTNFQEEHQLVGEKVQIKRDEKLNKGVIKRTKELAKYEWKDKTLEIKTFRTIDEIKECAEKLHNCIYRNYARPYANKRTDIFYAKQNGKIVVAIEVKDKKLIQARTFNNNDCNKEQTRSIHKWCKRNEIVWQ